MKYELAGLLCAVLGLPFWWPVYWQPRYYQTSWEWAQGVVGMVLRAAALALCVLGLVL